MAVLAPYVVGVVTAPLVARVLKPLFRGVVKASVGATLEAKKAAAEIREEYQSAATEATLQKVAANRPANAPKLQ